MLARTVDHLPQHQLGVAHDRHLGRHVRADAGGAGVDLHVGGALGPRGLAAEVLAAPEAEAHTDHDVGSSGEGLLPRAPHREWVVLGHRALTGAAAIHGRARELGQLAQLGCGVGPEHAVAGDQQGTLRPDQKLHGAVHLTRVAHRPQLVELVHLLAPLLLGLVTPPVQDVLGDLHHRHPLRRGDRLAERPPHVDLNGAPVDRALGVLRERPADLGAVRLLERADAVLGARVLAGEADHGALRHPREGEAGDGIGEAAPRRHAAHAGPPAGAGPAVGGVGGGLLVPHVDQPDVVVAQVGQDREGVTAVDGEQLRNLLLLEDTPHERAAVDLGHAITPLVRWRRHCTLGHWNGAGGLGGGADKAGPRRE